MQASICLASTNHSRTLQNLQTWMVPSRRNEMWEASGQNLWTCLIAHLRANCHLKPGMVLIYQKKARMKNSRGKPATTAKQNKKTAWSDNEQIGMPYPLTRSWLPLSSILYSISGTNDEKYYNAISRPAYVVDTILGVTTFHRGSGKFHRDWGLPILCSKTRFYRTSHL